jgi:hypothetical protein
VESLLEERRIKLSGVVSDLFGASGLRILEALAGGETDAVRLAALADGRLQCSAQQLTEALTGKRNRYLRVALCQASQAAVRAKQSVFQRKFLRLLPRLGYTKAIWVIARHLSVAIWKILHQGVEYVEYGMTQAPELAQRRLQRIKKQLCQPGYSDELKILQPQLRTI